MGLVLSRCSPRNLRHLALENGETIHIVGPELCANQLVGAESKTEWTVRTRAQGLTGACDLALCSISSLVRSSRSGVIET